MSEDSLDSAIISGMYRCSDNSDLPGGPFGQLLVVQGGYDTIAQLYFPWDCPSVYVRTGAPVTLGGEAGWFDWVELARCKAPELHDLSLRSGWKAFDNLCHYAKTQEDLVTVTVRAAHSSTIYNTSREVLADLPAGFRPSGYVSGVCAVDTADAAGPDHGTIHVTADGEIIINSWNSYSYVYATISFLVS